MQKNNFYDDLKINEILTKIAQSTDEEKINLLE